MHMQAGGTWSHPCDTRRLQVAVQTLEELSEGGCRNNCMTKKENWCEGYIYAQIKHYKHPVPMDELEMAASNAWKENKS